MKYFTKRQAIDYIAEDLYVDLSDENSEISNYAEAYFLNYLINKVPQERKRTIIDEWNSLPTAEEEQAFLYSIDPHFDRNFKNDLASSFFQILLQNFQ